MPSRENITWEEQEKDKPREKSKDKTNNDSAGNVSKQSKDKKNSWKQDDGKSEKKKQKKKSDAKKGNPSERDLTDKSNETNRSSKVDSAEDKNDAPEKKGDKDSDTKKKEDKSEIRPATRRDFYADDDDDDDDEDDVEKSKDRDNCEWGRPGCEDECNRFRARQRENDRCDSYGTRRAEYTEKAGACFLQDYCEKKRQDCSVGGESCYKKKDACGGLGVGKRDSGRGLAEKRCWRCREDNCDREKEERRPERCRDDGYKRDRYKSEREYGKCPLRCDRDWLIEDRCCGRDYNRKRDYGTDREAYDDDRCRSREGGYYDRQGGRKQTMDETGEGREGRDRSNRRDISPSKRDDKQSSDPKSNDRSNRRDSSPSKRDDKHSSDPKSNDRSSMKIDKSKDEFSQLKKELLCLQGEMEKMRLCLKTAVILAEKNKCTMTKVKEYIRCNLPDFCKIREKLKQCQLLRLKLSGESSTSSPKSRKEFEYLLCELKTLKCELDKLKLERR